LVPFLRQAIRTSNAVKLGFGFEGKYYAEGDRQYVNDIRCVSENIYQIKSRHWEGVGLVDGNFYYGIYKYTDHPDTYNAGNWGAHKAEIRFIDELPIFVIELSDKFDRIGERCRWEKAEKPDVR